MKINLKVFVAVSDRTMSSVFLINCGHRRPNWPQTLLNVLGSLLENCTGSSNGVYGGAGLSIFFSVSIGNESAYLV